MVEKRPISKDKYIIAGVLTFLIFSLGIVLGMVIDNKRVYWLEESSKEQELKFKSLQFQYLYLTELEKESDTCAALQVTLKKTIRDLSDSLTAFQDFKSNTQLNSGVYTQVGRRYLLDNLNYWMFARKSKALCGLDVVSILYFYSDDCEICPNQGVVLSYFKNVFGDKLLVFPIDIGLADDEPVVEIITSRFNITALPTLIIENKKLTGVIEKDELKKQICRFFKNESSC